LNAIRQALHSAARVCAKKAHLYWCEAEAAFHSEFKCAVNGKQEELMKARKEQADNRALYEQYLYKAKRIREMIK